MSKMIAAAITIRPQFYDLDPMGVVWHGNYPRFLEQARCALLDRLGFNYQEMMQTDYVWPIVDMRIKYVAPIRFDQQINVEARMIDYENRLRFTYLITDSAGGAVLTKAETTQFAVHKHTGETVIDAPPALLAAIEKWPA